MSRPRPISDAGFGGPPAGGTLAPPPRAAIAAGFSPGFHRYGLDDGDTYSRYVNMPDTVIPRLDNRPESRAVVGGAGNAVDLRPGPSWTDIVSHNHVARLVRR